MGKSTQDAQRLGVAGVTKFPTYRYKLEHNGPIVTEVSGFRHKGQVRELFNHRRIEAM